MARIRVLKENETDIYTLDDWRKALDTLYPTFKIAEVNHQNFQINAGEDFGEVTVNHNLGYHPFYIANVVRGSRSYLTTGYLVTDIIVPGEFDESVVAFYSHLESLNTLKIGAYLPADFADGNESFTAYWCIFLDEFGE